VRLWILSRLSQHPGISMLLTISVSQRNSWIAISWRLCWLLRPMERPCSML